MNNKAIILLLLYLSLSPAIVQPYPVKKYKPGETIIKTDWGGTEKFNKYMPGKSSPGCHSTAMAQILFYNRMQPYGTVEYISSKGYKVSLDLSDHKFDWNLFESNINDTTPGKISDEMARFVYYVSALLQKDYGTGNYMKKFHKKQISRHVNCEVHEYVRYKGLITSKRKLIRTVTREINELRPVYFHYTGFNGDGHSVVIDGYRNEGDNFMVHLVFGKGGNQTGWYDFNKGIISDNDLTYRSIITIKPKRQ